MYIKVEDGGETRVNAHVSIKNQTRQDKTRQQRCPTVPRNNDQATSKKKKEKKKKPNSPIPNRKIRRKHARSNLATIRTITHKRRHQPLPLHGKSKLNRAAETRRRRFFCV
jgi:hypothetical protein